MSHRGVQIAVLLFWLGSMSWLVGTKVIPSWHDFAVPDQRIFRPEATGIDERVGWRIRWQGQRVGTATTQVRRQPTGHGMVTSQVRLNDLPLGQIVEEGVRSLGLLGRMFPAINSQLRITMDSDSVMEFTPLGELERFRSKVSIAEVGELVRLVGEVCQESLQITAIAGDGIDANSVDERKPLITKTIPFPRDAFVADSMAPHSRLTQLRVGQSWQFRTFRAFSPHDPYRMIQATVEREEMIAWSGFDDVEPCFVVTFADVGGSGVTSTRAPSSRLWVRRDGTVLKQQMQIGSADVEFERMTAEELANE